MRIKTKINKIMIFCLNFMVTLDFSKCKTKEDVEKVFEENKNELSLQKKALKELQNKIRD